MSPLDLLYFRINGKERPCERELWELLLGPKPEDDYDCNGCTCSPDYWLGVPMWVPCRIHDWHYDALGPAIHRLIADITFRINIWRTARYVGAPRHRAIYLSLIYSFAVIAAGKRNFKRKKAA